jgi:cytochrome b
MKKVLIWDLPVRVVHWLLAASFLGAFAIATIGSDDSPTFPLHALLGLVAGFLVVLRLVWGFVGTRYARFAAFELRPAALARYLRGALARRAAGGGAGHNPATSWFVIALFVGLAGLGLTGLAMARGSETFEELHEVLAWSVLVLVAVHVAGVLVHVARTRENIVASMVVGTRAVPALAAIRSPRRGAALLLVALVAGFGALLASGYDAGARRVTLPLIGTALTIGEAEGEEGAPEGAARGVAAEKEDQGDEDDD